MALTARHQKFYIGQTENGWTIHHEDHQMIPENERQHEMQLVDTPMGRAVSPPPEEKVITKVYSFESTEKMLETLANVIAAAELPV